MTVTGRVLDPDGKPVEGAVVDLVAAAPLALGRRERGDSTSITLLGQGQSDGDGRFRLDAPRTASIRVFEVYALAAAPGYGLGWAELNPDAEQPAAEIRLQPEQLIRVRLVDVTGRPARGVEVRVAELRPHERQGHLTTASGSGTTRPRDSAPGRGRSRPTTRGGSPCPASAAALSVSLRVRDLPLRPPGPGHRSSRAPRPPRRSPWRSSRPGSSRAASWPPTPASPSPMPSSRPRPWSRTSTPRVLHHQVPRRRPGAVRHEPDRRRELHPGRLPHRRRAVPDPAGRIRVDQGGGQGDPRHQAPPRRVDPRQGDRGRDRIAPWPRRASSSSPCGGGDERALGLAEPSWPARTTARSRSPSRPARDTCSSSARPATTSSARSAIQSALLAVGPAGCATTPTPSSPTRSRPATRRTKSPRRCGPA